MTWALKRQIFYVSIFFAFFLIFGFLIIYPRINMVPNCVDNGQSSSGAGIDCGGPCAPSCIGEIDPISVLWSRAFQVVPGRYNAVAYLLNHNKNTVVNKINYRFRFADSNNIYIGKREGTAYVPPSENFAIFEPAIDIGNSIPVYVTFEFTQEPHWVQIAQEKIDQSKILISNIILTDETTSPKLSATIKNNSLFTIPEVTVVAILYDSSNNAVSASRTYLNTLSPEKSTEVNFTWPEPLPSHVIVKEIIPMFNIFSVK